MGASYRLPTRHFCSKCDQRVYPFDTMEALTEAPRPGASGKPILLYSFNAQQRERKEDRLAYCFNCKELNSCYVEDRVQYTARYYRRAGIKLRFSGKGVSDFTQQLNAKLDERRGAGIISIRPARRRRRDK